LQGDTPGLLGTCGDWASIDNVCRVRSSFDVVVSGATVHSQDAGDAEVFVINKNALIQALTFGAEYAAALKDGAMILPKLLKDFGVTGQYYIKMYNGKEYIIFKGYAGLRKVVTGTRYLSDNAKVLEMAIGRAGVIRSGIKAGVLSLVLIAAADVAEYFLRDDETLEELGVKLFDDIAKTLISTAIAVAVSALVAAAGAPVVVPLAVGLAVGVLVTWGLDHLDEKYRLKEKLQEWVDRTSIEIRRSLDEAREALNEAGRRAVDAVEEMLVRAVARELEELERELEEKLWRLVNPIPRF
jgi:hypothetical protein